MGYDHGDSFPFDFEPNGIHLVQNRKENCPHDHIPFNVKGIGSIVFSVHKSQHPRSRSGAGFYQSLRRETRTNLSLQDANGTNLLAQIIRKSYLCLRKLTLLCQMCVHYVSCITMSRYVQ